MSGIQETSPKILVRKGRFPYVTDVPHLLVHDPHGPRKGVDYVLVTALTGYTVFAVPRSDIVG